MKKRLLLAGLLFGTLAANAQTTVFSENFNESDGNFANVTGFTQFNLDGNTNNDEIADYFDPNYTWTLLSYTDTPDNYFAASSSYFTTVDQADRWLITPAINLTTYSGQAATLTFDVASGNPDYLESYEILVSSTGSAIADFTAAPVLTVTDEISVNDETGAFSTRTVNISSSVGKTIYIAFRHRSTDEYLLFLDNIKVTVGGTASVDKALASSFTVSPNPTNSIINISNANNTLFSAVTVADINGRTVKSSKFDGVANAQINVSDLASGVYMMTVTSDKGNITKKIVKN